MRGSSTGANAAGGAPFPQGIQAGLCRLRGKAEIRRVATHICIHNTINVFLRATGSARPHDCPRRHTRHSAGAQRRPPARTHPRSARCPPRHGKSQPRREWSLALRLERERVCARAYLSVFECLKSRDATSVCSSSGP